MTVRKNRIPALILSFVLMAVCFLLPVTAFAGEAAPDPGLAYINDQADLLSDTEEEDLYEIMKYALDYGNMVFITITDSMGYNSSDYIEMLYQTSPQLKGTNAVIYMIDMDNRMLWITGYGTLKKNISPDYANLITDNVYKYASDEQYGRCAIEGYKQIVTRISGVRISGPLRTAGNFSIALIAATVICFLIAYITSSSRKAGSADIVANIEKRINLSNPNVAHTTTQRIYDPPSSSSGSSGGSRSFGGGGGGGFHGGGGGHGF